MSRINDPIQSGSTEQLRESASNVGESLREMGSQVKDVAHEQLKQIRQSAADYYEQGREKAGEWEQRFEDYVREQPVKSILAAAGIGLFLGFLWRRL